MNNPLSLEKLTEKASPVDPWDHHDFITDQENDN